MTQMDELLQLNVKESVAWEKWHKTSDIRYLNQVKNYLDRRVKLLGLRTPCFAEGKNEKERKSLNISDEK